jgi:hypothetical protein
VGVHGKVGDHLLVAITKSAIALTFSASDCRHTRTHRARCTG